eukprot:scaffold3440_cov135-Isochrysis_galbana.AAC.11
MGRQGETVLSAVCRVFVATCCGTSYLDAHSARALLRLTHSTSEMTRMSAWCEGLALAQGYTLRTAYHQRAHGPRLLRTPTDIPTKLQLGYIINSNLATPGNRKLKSIIN